MTKHWDSWSLMVNHVWFIFLMNHHRTSMMICWYIGIVWEINGDSTKYNGDIMVISVVKHQWDYIYVMVYEKLGEQIWEINGDIIVIW